MIEKLRVWKGDKDVSDYITTINGRGNIGGWSQHELIYVEKDATGHDSAPEHVGWLESGFPCDFADGYRFKVEKVQD